MINDFFQGFYLFITTNVYMQLLFIVGLIVCVVILFSTLYRIRKYSDQFVGFAYNEHGEKAFALYADGHFVRLEVSR